MRQLAAFLTLSRRDRALLIEALATVCLFRLAVHVFSIERLRAWSGRLERGTGPIDRVVWAVRVASRWTPGTTCLASAFALQRLLSGQGYPSELHIGVMKQKHRFAAHAWVVGDGRVLIGEQGQIEYTPLARWCSGNEDRFAADRADRG